MIKKKLPHKYFTFSKIFKGTILIYHCPTNILKIFEIFYSSSISNFYFNKKHNKIISDFDRGFITY